MTVLGCRTHATALREVRTVFSRSSHVREAGTNPTLACDAVGLCTYIHSVGSVVGLTGPWSQKRLEQMLSTRIVLMTLKKPKEACTHRSGTLTKVLARGKLRTHSRILQQGLAGHGHLQKHLVSCKTFLSSSCNQLCNSALWAALFSSMICAWTCQVRISLPTERPSPKRGSAADLPPLFWPASNVMQFFCSSF